MDDSDHPWVMALRPSPKDGHHHSLTLKFHRTGSSHDPYLLGWALIFARILRERGGGQKLLTRRIPNYHFHCTLLSSSPGCFSVFKFAAFVYICAHNIVYVTNILVMLDDLKKVCFM